MCFAIQIISPYGTCLFISVNYMISYMSVSISYVRSLVMCTYTVKTKLCISNVRKGCEGLHSRLYMIRCHDVASFSQGEHTVLTLLYLLCIWWNKAVEIKHYCTSVFSMLLKIFLLFNICSGQKISIDEMFECVTLGLSKWSMLWLMDITSARLTEYGSSIAYARCWATR